MPVGRLQCYVGEHDYTVCTRGVDGPLEQRDSLLRMMGQVGGQNTTGESTFCKTMAETLLTNLYAFQQAVSAIRQRYFDGEEPH